MCSAVASGLWSLSMWQSLTSRKQDRVRENLLENSIWGVRVGLCRPLVGNSGLSSGRKVSFPREDQAGSHHQPGKGRGLRGGPEVGHVQFCPCLLPPRAPAPPLGTEGVTAFTGAGVGCGLSPSVASDMPQQQAQQKQQKGPRRVP